MENLILFLILFVIFFIFFLINYIIKRKKNNLKKFIGMELVKAKKEDYEKVGLLLVLVNSSMAAIIWFSTSYSAYLYFLCNYWKYLRKKI